MGIDIGSILKSIAPKLAMAIPIPGLNVIASQFIADKLGVAPEEVPKVMKNPTADQLEKLREADHDFGLKMKEMDIDIEEIHAEDRDSARRNNAATKSKIPGILGLVTVIGFFATLGVMLSPWAPEEGNEVLYVLIGALGSKTTQIYNYFFGSSSGSKDKTALMSKN